MEGWVNCLLLCVFLLFLYIYVKIGGALTFGEGLFEAFPVDMSEDVVRLPVEMS